VLHYEELPHIYYIHDEFSPLNRLYPGDPVEVGYRGNMYQITLDSIIVGNTEGHAFFEVTRYHLALRELKERGYVTIGEGTFDGGAYTYPSSLALVSQIKSAIIQLNVRPTDYYK
jgi:hypothetical protein